MIQIEIGRRYEGIDLGYKPVVTIGNYVWEDNNYNGLQDDDESGLSGIKIFLLKAKFDHNRQCGFWIKMGCIDLQM